MPSEPPNRKNTLMSAAVAALMIASAAGLVATAGSSMTTTMPGMERNDLAPGTDTPAPVHITVAAKEKTVKVLGAYSYTAWTYNGTVPGPIIRLTQGTPFDVTLLDDTSEPHSFHTHMEDDYLADDGSSHTAPVGLVPHQADDPLGATPLGGMGVHVGMGMNPLGPYDPRNDSDIAEPGGSYTYHFVAYEPGAFLYHCHVFPAAEHIEKGLFGLIIVYPPGWTWTELPKNSSYGNTKAWITDPQGNQYFEDVVMISEIDPTDATTTVSVPTTGPTGKIHVANFMAWNDPYVVGPVKTGTPVRLIVSDIGDEVHSWHVHGHYFNIVDKFDPAQARVLRRADTMLIAPGETYLTTLTAGKPGWWFLHDHIVPDAYGGMVPWLHVTS